MKTILRTQIKVLDKSVENWELEPNQEYNMPYYEQFLIPVSPASFFPDEESWMQKEQRKLLTPFL